jgi:transposase
MNRLDAITRAQVIGCLTEGCSIRSAVRMTGVAKKTVMRVLVEVGEVCADYQGRAFRNLRCKRLQLDEAWAWIYCKEKNRTHCRLVSLLLFLAGACRIAVARDLSLFNASWPWM